MQENHSDCSRMAQHAMCSQIPLCLPKLLTRPFNQTPHRNLSNLNLHGWFLEPQQSRGRASLKQCQHESRLKEDQLDQSEVKWAFLTKWCLSKQCDLRAPPIKSRADFLLYLFQDRKLDKCLKSDRSLCSVRALRYDLDRTSDLRQYKELVFVAFLFWTGPQTLGSTRR